MEKDNPNKIDTGLLHRYLEGTDGNKEQQQIDEWFSDLYANEELKKFSENIWNDLPTDISLPGYDEDRMHDRIHHILRLEEAAALQKEREKARLVMIITKIAAALFIPLALFTMFNWKGNIEGEQAVSRAEIFSPFGARTSFILPDGSTGWLNGGSSLNFPIQFRGKSRTVELMGEAYFDVIINPEKPFIVVTDGMKVRVYGTSFNVKAYPDDRSTEITLETGEIEVFGEDGFGRGKSMGVMAPGERGVLSKATGIFIKDNVNVYQYTAWKEGKLVFRNEPMIQVVKNLNRWYNVNIIIRDSQLESYTYRATFVDEKLDEVLKIFQHTSPIVYKELGRKKHADGTFGKRTIELYYHTHN